MFVLDEERVAQLSIPGIYIRVSTGLDIVVLQ